MQRTISTASLDRSAFRDLQAVFEAGAGHIGGEMSAIDILTALYFRVLRIRPRTAESIRSATVSCWSKGHVALALYVTLARRGFIPEEEISTFLKPHSRLNGHPNCTNGTGVETNTGPLGHGLPVGGRHGEGRKGNRREIPHLCVDGDGEIRKDPTGRLSRQPRSSDSTT